MYQLLSTTTWIASSLLPLFVYNFLLQLREIWFLPSTIYCSSIPVYIYSVSRIVNLYPMKETLLGYGIHAQLLLSLVLQTPTHFQRYLGQTFSPHPQ